MPEGFTDHDEDALPEDQHCDEVEQAQTEAGEPDEQD